ncbi:MAG: hypothetical protein R3D26_07880 [Cyanobacteriota/Melainabacteria group bacterium]
MSEYATRNGKRDKEHYRAVPAFCATLHGKVAGATSIETDSLCAYFYLVLAKESYNSNLIDQTMGYYCLFKSLISDDYHKSKRKP